MSPEIFIIGHARSGTTVLTHILNTDQEVCILQEAEIYWNYEVSHYAEVFNRRGSMRKRTWRKGNYIPPCVPGSLNGRRVIEGLSKYYRRVGDKIALGPGRIEQIKIWEFFAKNYFNANYIFTFRDPLQAAASMKRMFPENSYTEILDTWITSVALMMRFISFLPNVCAIPMERYSACVLQTLNERLGTMAVISGASIHQARKISRDDIFGITEKENEKLHKCENIYYSLLDAWDANKLSFYSENDLYGYLGCISRDLMEALSPKAASEISALSDVDPAVIDPRRAVLTSYAQVPLALPEWQEAVESYVSDFPQDGFGHYIFALMLYGNSPNNCERALAEFNEAERCGYVPFWIKYNRAYVYKKMGNHERAIKDIEDAAKEDPTHRDAQEMLERWTLLEE
jgi:tetratricopeptide (TPR) repeat protein